MLRRISSARRAASLSTSASSAPARLFLPSTATSATSKPAPLLSPLTCPLGFPAITSSCRKPFAERRAVVMVNLLFLHFQSAAPSGRITPRSGGNHESHRRHCSHSLCGNHPCSSRQPRYRRRAASRRLLRRIVSHRTPVGREAPRHSQSGQSPRLHAASLRPPASCRLALRQGQRRMDRRKIQGVRSRHPHRAV